LFLYIHIRHNLKKSNELEVYEIDNVYKDKIEEICDLRQPVVFDVDDDNCNKLINKTNKDYLVKNYSVFNINIRNVADNNEESELYLPLSLNMSCKLFNEDKEGKFISENNSDFLQETGVIKHIKYNDQLFRPPLVSNCNYDFLCGSNNSTTPFRYEINYRNYFIVTEGSIVVKLSPPKSIKYLHCVYDYENFEFRSPINSWTPQQEYIDDFDKIKCLEMTLKVGKCIYIPPYWFYSFKFSEDSSSAISLKYRTYMNNITILPEICMSILQNQNIIRNYVKKVSNNNEDEKDLSKNSQIVKEE
jgi:hypothetical protein